MRKYWKRFFTLCVVLSLGTLTSCSNNENKESTKESQKNNIAVHGKYIVNVKDEKYGLMDFEKKQVIETTYDYLGYISSADLFTAQKDGKWGVIDIDEKVIIPFEFQDIGLGNTNEKFYASDFKTTSVYDFEGKKEKTYNYGLVWNSGEGVVRVAEDVKITDNVLSARYGLNNESGQEILKPEFTRVNHIYDYDKKTGKNKVVALNMEKDGKAGVYNLRGEVIVPMEYDSAKSFNQWMDKYSITYSGNTQSYYVMKDDKYGVYDNKGNQILETKYDSIDGSQNGYIARENEQDTVFDLKGNKLFSDVSLDVEGLSKNGFMSVMVKKSYQGEYSRYYIDSSGNKVELEALKDAEIIRNLGRFDELGNATIKFYSSNGEECALVNEKGNIVIGPLKEDEKRDIDIQRIGVFNEGANYLTPSTPWTDEQLGSTDYLVTLRVANENNLYQTVQSSLYNKEGKKLTDFAGTIEGRSFTNEFYSIFIIEGDKPLYGLMDRSGNIVVEPTYDYLGNYYDDYIIARKGDKNFLLDNGNGKVVIEY